MAKAAPAPPKVFRQAAAKDLANSDVPVNALLPGDATDTGMVVPLDVPLPLREKLSAFAPNFSA
jgi:hypothetical protein